MFLIREVLVCKGRYLLASMASVMLLGFLAPTAHAHYDLDRHSTTSGGGTWGSILRLEASVSGSTITFNVSKQSGSFNTAGTMYLKVGTYEPWGADRDVRSLSAGSFLASFTHDLDDHAGYPKYFYGRYESSNGGYAWVGPIEVSFVNGSPGAPSISGTPSSATVNESVSVRVYRGQDPDGDQVKVQCTATGSNRTNASPYASGFADGGNSSLPSFLFHSTGTQTIYCATFDRYGAGSPTAQRTISVAGPNSPPGPPTISASPSVATLGDRVFVTVWRGSEPNGELVKVECVSVGSDRTDANPFDSGFGSGGSSTSASFLFSQLGSRVIYCTSFDPGGTASPTVSRSIEVVGPQPNVGNVTVSPGSLGAGDQQIVSWQSQNQNWFLMQLFDAAGAQPVDTSAFLSSSCLQLGAGAGTEGCLQQINPSSTETTSWVIPPELAAGDYTIKVAVWYSDGNAAGAFSPPFTVEEPDSGGDFVNVSPWAQDAAAYLVAEDVVVDPPDHDLRGTSDANRAEVATLVYRSLGGGRFQADDSFAGWYGTVPLAFLADVADPDAWYQKPATYLAKLAYDDPVTVFDQDLCIFRPAQTISRGWSTKVLMEAWDLAPLSSFSGVALFDDVPTTHPAAGYVYRARQLGVIDGTTNLFRPDEAVDRQDLFVMLHRLLDGSVNPVAPVSQPIPQTSDFELSRNCSAIGHRFEQPVLDGPHPPQVEISVTGPQPETLGALVGVYAAELEATISGLDTGTYLAADGTAHNAQPFCAWLAGGGVFVDLAPAGEPPYCRVRWIAPADVSGTSGTAVSEVTLFVGDGLGNEVRRQTTLLVNSPSADPAAPSLSMDPLPATVTANQVVEISGDVSDAGDPQSPSFGVLAVRVTASMDGGQTWTSVGEADLLAGGRWSLQWPAAGAFDAVTLRAEAVNQRGNRNQAERTVTVRIPYTIDGFVMNSFGEAVENSLVELSRSGLTSTLRSDSAGAFRFTEHQHGLQPADDYRLSTVSGSQEVTLDGLSLGISAPTRSAKLIVDTAAPSTLPSVPGGLHSSAVDVGLECFDDRSGCAATYFTIDGSSPTEASALYSATLTVEQDTILRYFSVDHAGNAEAVQTQTYDVGSNADSSSGLILAPAGEQAGDVTVSADAADPDGLQRVRVTFVGGGTLVLCDAVTTPCAGGGPFTQSGIDPSAYGITESGAVDLELWVEDALGHQELVDVRSFLWQAGATLSTFTLTVVKEGDGDGTVSGTGIDCPPGCTTATATLDEGTPVTLTGSGEQFIGFTGETCYGIGSCSFSMTRDRTIHAGFALPDSFRVLYTSPANGDTGVGVSSIPRVVFNREVFAGPQLGAIVLRHEDGTPVAMTPVVRSADMYLSLVTESALERGEGYVVELPSTAVLDDQGSPLAAPYGFSFFTEEEGAPEMHVVAYPREVIEGHESKVSIWFEESTSHDRTLALSSGPSGELIHPSEALLPAGEILLEIDVDGRLNPGSLADFVETLQVTETALGTQESVQITVVNRTPSNGSHLHWLGSVLTDDEDGDGVFEADEFAELAFEVVNQGSSGIANVSLEFEVATGTSGLDILGGTPYRCDIGFLDPGEAGSCTESLRADEELPTGSYHIHVTGFSSQDGMRALAEIDVVNNSQPDFIVSMSNITSSELDPGTTIDLRVHARNAGDGFSPELPLVQVLMEVDGEERLLYETYFNARGYVWSQQSLEFPVTAPDVPGEHPIRARINPAGHPDRPQIPESDTTNNDATELILRVAAPNQPPVFDPLPDTVHVDVGDLLSFAASASDPNGDALTYSLVLGAPAGVAIDPASGVLTWTPLCSQGPGSHAIEILVADPDGATDAHPLTVIVGARADLRVTKTASSTSALPGGPVGFTVAVTNLGPSCATDVTVRDTFASSLADVTWTCAASAGSSCSSSGSGDLLDGAVSLLRDGTATYEISARVLDGASGLVINEASATVSGGAVDPVPVNDVDTAAVTLRDLDFGDAGDVTLDSAWSYPVTLGDDGARHGLDSGPHLGALIDGEADGQPSPAADGDDLDTTDDEDGVVLTTALVPCQMAEVEVTASAPALLSAWIDFGRDGGWGEAADAVLADEPLAAGVNALTVPVPCAAANGDTFARFRLSSAGGLGVGGLAVDGEVEDYSVTIEQVLHTLTVTTSGTGSGVVTSTPTGIDCGADCSEDFPAGTPVTLTAAPGSGSEFSGWSGEGCSTGSCQVTMDAARAVAATFELVEPCHLLTLTKQGQGADPVAQPVASAACSTGRYHAGEPIQLTAQPAAGWVVDGWVGTANDASTSQVNQLTMPASDHAASVVYAESSAPTVLLVDDDDDDPDVRGYYTETLDALGVTYDVWPTGNSDNEPDAAILGLYSKVIWFTGASFRDSVGPGASAEVALASYLDAGGCLFLSSQDYLLDRGETSFMSAYLGLGSSVNDSKHDLVTGQGEVFGGLGPYALSFPVGEKLENFSDLVMPDGTAEVAFLGDGGEAAIDKLDPSFRTIFLAFPLEALGAEARYQVLRTALNACELDCAGPFHLTLENHLVTGVELVTSCDRLYVGEGYQVLSGGELTLRAPGMVVFGDGFAVTGEGRLRVEVEEVETP